MHKKSSQKASAKQIYRREINTRLLWSKILCIRGPTPKQNGKKLPLFALSEDIPPRSFLFLMSNLNNPDGACEFSGVYTRNGPYGDAQSPSQQPQFTVDSQLDDSSQENRAVSESIHLPRTQSTSPISTQTRYRFHNREAGESQEVQESLPYANDSRAARQFSVSSRAPSPSWAIESASPGSNDSNAIILPPLQPSGGPGPYSMSTHKARAHIPTSNPSIPPYLGSEHYQSDDTHLRSSNRPRP
ncbi:hypothetical protein RhiJN_13155 [Ceratobasidium sp. AG-Ba]|nr:hypothetical protein RhiJN_13155 [Ceratobasidium sp. AG-Ba]